MNKLKALALFTLSLTTQTASAFPLTAESVSVRYLVDGLDMVIKGEFRIPTIAVDADFASVSYSFSGVFGGAIWRTGRSDEQISGWAGGRIALGYNGDYIGEVFTGGGGFPWSTAIGYSSSTSIDGMEPDTRFTPSLDALREGSAFDAGGYVPVFISAYIYAGGLLAYVSEPPWYPSAAIFAGAFDLDYSLDTARPSLASPTYYFEQIVDGGQPLPQELREQIPEFLLPPVAGIPEPPTLSLFIAVLSFLLMTNAVRFGIPRSNKAKRG